MSISKVWKLLFIGVLAIVSVLIAGFLYLYVFSDPEEEVSLEAAVAAISTSTSVSTATAAATATQPATATATQTATADITPDLILTGSWTLSNDKPSFVGYRVNEILVNTGEFTAVGRTSSVQGQLQFDGDSITEVEISADLTQLKSDNQYRDRALRRQAIETNEFPTATFRLADPIQVSDFSDGAAVVRSVVGELTLHGVTRDVTLEIAGELVDDTVVVVGSLEILFSDYEIDTPSSRSVVSIEDYGVMEFQLFFVKP